MNERATMRGPRNFISAAYANDSRAIPFFSDTRNENAHKQKSLMTHSRIYQVPEAFPFDVSTRFSAITTRGIARMENVSGIDADGAVRAK